MAQSIQGFVLKNKYFLLLFLFILVVSLALRFYGYESAYYFGWDQARDAWKVRDILQGHITLDGPKTGVGNMHLGPLYFYFLVPFYALMNLDPVGSLYFLILANIINFIAIFFVSYKLFSIRWALFAVFFFGVSNYIIKQSIIPWNVSLVPAVSILIFYSIYQIKTAPRLLWYILLGILMGFFFHLHFTAIFFPIIVILSLLPYDRKFKKFIPLVLSFLIAGIFLIPTLIFNYQQSQLEMYRYSGFISDYMHGFYGRFFLLRAQDAFISFRLLTFFSFANIIQFIIPFLFFILIFFEKNKEQKLIGYLMIPWFIIPVIIFTLYSGPISDYYYIFQVPIVILILIYLQIRLLKVSPKFIILLVLLWTVYAFFNTQEYIAKRTDQGLNQQKRETLQAIQEGKTIDYNEGDIKSYLYSVWTKDYLSPESIE